MTKGIKFMLISTFAFSLMTLCVKSIPNIPAYEIIFFRSLISLILSLIFIFRKKLNPFGNNHTYLILRGVFGIIALTSFFITIQKIPLASAVTIQYLSPIFTAIFAIFLLREKLHSMQILFFIVSFTGIVLLKGFDHRVDMNYLILGIISAVFAGLAYNCIRKLKDSDHPIVVVFYFPLIATPIMAILSYFNWVQPDLKEFLILILTGIFTQIGQVYMTKALQSDSVAKISSMKYLGVVYALIYGYLFFGETYTLQALSALALVVAGVVLNVFWKTSQKTI